MVALRPSNIALRLVGSDGRVVNRPPVMMATVMLSSMFRVRNASIIVRSGGMMLYHGAISISAVRDGVDRDASAQIAAKMTAEAAILMIIFVFTSFVQLGVFLFLYVTCPTIH